MHRLAEHTAEGWKRGPVALQDVAEAIGANKAATLRRIGHTLERTAYRDYVNFREDNRRRVQPLPEEDGCEAEVPAAPVPVVPSWPESETVKAARALMAELPPLARGTIA